MGGDNPEIWKAAAMADHFDKIQKLPEKIDGVPNFRRVPGYKVYCCGQPTIAGFENAINKACGDTYPKTNKIIWLNMRQESIVYVNGNPICARPPNKIGEYAELGDVTRGSVKKDEEEFFRVIEGRAKGNDNKLKYVDVNKKENEVEVKELITLSQVIEGLKEKFPGLVHMRIPVCNSAAPVEADFDTICKTLQGSAVNCPVIVNCQVGLSRSTTGCVAACLFREFQLAASYEGLVETVPGVNLDLLKMDRYKMDMSKDPLFRGEFEVIKELIAELADGKASKRECDKVIDKNGPTKTGGTGIKQLRENIAESKLSYEIMDDAAQAFLKTKIMDNIHKYFYLIAFTGYIREMAALAISTATDEDKAKHGLAGGKISTPGDQLKLAKTFCGVDGEARQPEDHRRGGQGQAALGEGHPRLRPQQPGVPRFQRLQGQPGQDHSRHLPDCSHHVLRHAPRRPQEARQVQVRLQDPDEDPAHQPEVRGGRSD